MSALEEDNANLSVHPEREASTTAAQFLDMKRHTNVSCKQQVNSTPLTVP